MNEVVDDIKVPNFLNLTISMKPNSWNKKIVAHFMRYIYDSWIIINCLDMSPRFTNIDKGQGFEESASANDDTATPFSGV